MLEVFVARKTLEGQFSASPLFLLLSVVGHQEYDFFDFILDEDESSFDLILVSLFCEAFGNDLQSLVDPGLVLLPGLPAHFPLDVFLETAVLPLHHHNQVVNELIIESPLIHFLHLCRDISYLVLLLLELPPHDLKLVRQQLILGSQPLSLFLAIKKFLANDLLDVLQLRCDVCL